MLRNRLIIGLSLILLLVSIGQWMTLHYSIRKVAMSQMELHLIHDGDTLLSALELDAQGQPEIKEVAVEEVYRQRFSGHYYQVFLDGRLALASPSLGGHELPARTAATGIQLLQEIRGPKDQEVLILTKGYSLHGHDVSITVGEELSDMNRQIDEQSITSLGLILPLLVLAVIMQNLTIRREFQSLATAQEQLSKIRKGIRGRIDARVPGEIQPLVNEINHLLELVHRRLLQSRTALGNLAHAFKTPLAVLLQRIDDPALPPAVGADLKAQVAVIRDRVDRELKRARLAGHEPLCSPIDIREELRVMSDVLGSVYRDKDLKIRVHAPEQPISYDREDFLELVGNLADNACKWAKEEVYIGVSVNSDRGLLIRIADDGPGCEPEQIRQLGQRGLRLDETTSGHGLGLAICQDIVDFYKGTLKIGRDAELGGLQVLVELPSLLQSRLGYDEPREQAPAV